MGLRRTRPYWPQTNGKAEASLKILQAEWAYRRRYASNEERLGAIPVFLREYDHDRPRGGIGGAVPASAVNDISGTYGQRPGANSTSQRWRPSARTHWPVRIAATP